MKGYEVRSDDGGDVHVLGPEGWDDDLAEAARSALHDLAPSSLVKYASKLERFLNLELRRGESCDAFLDESTIEARQRVKAYLEALGCTVRPARKRRDKAQSVTRTNGSTAEIEIAIRVLRDFYEALITDEHFLDANPLEVDGWAAAAAERIAEGLKGKNKYGHMSQESGLQFRVASRDYYPPLPHDPVGCGRRAVAAAYADANRWPVGGLLLVEALADGGARYEDTHVLHAADWAVGSRFGQGIIAPDKGSRGVRDKTIVISERLRQRLSDDFDARHAVNPSIPNMACLRQMLADARLDELATIPLFPNAAGVSFKYSNFNNDLFRPSMIKHEVTVDSNAGRRRVTPHWLRHAHVTARVARIFKMATSHAEIQEALLQLREDMGWKSDMIERYAANFFLTMRLLQRIATMDAINAEGEIRPRLTTVRTGGSALLSPAIADLHKGLPL